MGVFDSIIRDALSTAKDIIGPDLMVDVIHYPVIGRDAYGPKYGDPVPMRGILEYKSEGIELPDGSETTTKAVLSFLEPVTLTDRDQFDIPDLSGTVERVDVLTFESFIPSDTVPFYAVVHLGNLARGGGR